MKLINTKYLETLNPCNDRFDNWKKHYNDKDINLYDFLDLTEITHGDKLWVFFRSIPKDLIPLIAADFAEEVLHIFEEEHPYDLRPRKAIEAARNKKNHVSNTYTSIAAANNSNSTASYSAAYASVYATSSVTASYYASSGYAAEEACYSAYYSVRADFRQEKTQIDIMKKYLRKL